MGNQSYRKDNKMSRIRMNTELRNKILNRYRESAEQENTQELESMKQAREEVDSVYPKAFDLATTVVGRSYPPEDVQTCRTLKQKYGEPLDVVAKDKCFNFSYARENPSEDEDKDVTDILAKQNGKDDNPHKTKHVDLNDKALGYSGYSSYGGGRDNNNGIAKDFDKQYELDIIGTSHCRSRTIGCTEQEFQVFQMFKKAKGQLIVCHQKWIDSITKQCDAMKTGLKAYRYLSEGVELMTELNVHCDEADLIRTNSTGLVIYNPVNLASMIKGMKNTTITRDQKIAIRKAYEQNQVN